MNARVSRFGPLAPAAMALFLAALPSPATGQSQTLFFEDFEGGQPGGWALVSFTNGLWHFANPGSCGSITHSLAYSKPATCNYDTNGPNSGLALSPGVILSGQGPLTLSFDSTLALDATGDTCSVSVSGSGYDLPLADKLSLDTSGTPHSFSLTLPDFVAGHQPSFKFRFNADGEGDGSAGWSIDNIQITNGGPTWTDVGHGKAGGSGVPVLAGEGSLKELLFSSLDLASAAPNAASVLFVGLSVSNLAFKGGVLVPAPQLMLPMTTNGAGAVDFFFQMPSGVPSGTKAWFQFWIKDGTAANGVAASNGLMGVAY